MALPSFFLFIFLEWQVSFVFYFSFVCATYVYVFLNQWVSLLNCVCVVKDLVRGAEAAWRGPLCEPCADPVPRWHASTAVPFLFIRSLHRPQVGQLTG